eukprot:4277147-Ditylum_brightwellii.AAC.2
MPSSLHAEPPVDGTAIQVHFPPPAPNIQVHWESLPLYEEMYAPITHTQTKEIQALVAESYDGHIQDVGEPITSTNVDETIQRYCLVTLDEADAIIFYMGALKLVTFNAADFIRTLNPPLLTSLARLSASSQVQEGGTVWWHIQDDYGCL